MENRMSPAEFLQLTTIRIECSVPEGTSTGTGFFFGLNYNEESGICVPVIVTNKHVIKNSMSGKLRFSLKDKLGKPLWGKFYDVRLQNFESLWIIHPEDSVDLCVLPIASIHHMIEKADMNLNYTLLTSKDIPSSEELKTDFSRIEEITVIGYQDGIWDAINNIPITRKGITATPLQMDFENTASFLVDAAIYNGSSGSPVFVFNQGSFYKPDGSVNIASRLKLVGIIHKVFQHSIKGELKIVDVPTASIPVAESMIPNNLGIAIHARKLLDFEKLVR